MLLRYKPGDTIELLGPLNGPSGPVGDAAEWQGWTATACLTATGGFTPALVLACSWPAPGVLRLFASGEATQHTTPGTYDLDVILRRDSDGYTLSTPAHPLEIVARRTPLPGASA